jgi:hypothetical protein
VAEKQGDRNGDGDLTDAVLGVYDGRTGTVHNLRLATFADQGGLAPDGRSVVLVPEVQQGKDLNGDGDLLDNVLHEVFLDPPRG